MRIADLSTVELQRLGSAVLRAYVDANADQEPATGSEVRRWVLRGEFLADLGAMPQAAIGPVTVARQGDDRAYVAAAVPPSTANPERVGVLLAAELATADGLLRVARVGHFVQLEREVDASERWVVEPEPARHLTNILGSLPEAEGARGRWVTAAAVICEYRRAWGVNDQHLALGEPPRDLEQRAERERAVRSVRQLLSEIDRGHLAQDEADRAEPGPDLTR